MGKFSESSCRGGGLVAGCLSVRQRDVCVAHMLLAVFMLFGRSAFAEVSRDSKVLLLHSYHAGLIWSDGLTEGVVSALNGGRLDIQLTVEYMDTKRISDSRHYENLLAVYDHKFKGVLFDVVVAADDNAFFFALEHRDKLFKGVPIVFCGLSYYDEAWRTEYGNFTGIVEKQDILKTMNLALDLHGDTNTIFVINDLTATGRRRHKQYVEAGKKLDRQVAIEFLEDYSMDGLLTVLRSLPEKSVVILHNFNRDNQGRLFSHRQAGTMICDASVRPVYSSQGHNLGLGAVGGFMTLGKVHGEIAGEMALEILEGKKADDIPVVLDSPNPAMFDHAQLAKWEIVKEQLPEASGCINEPSQMLEARRRLVVVFSFAAIEGAIILLLVVNAFRKHAGRQFFANLEYRFVALAVSFGLVIWVFDTAIDYLLFYKGNSFWSLLILDAPPHEVYMRLLILISFTLFGMIVSALLVKRRLAEQALKDSSERLLLALSAANDGLWDWDFRTNKVYFSPRYYTMLGYEPNEFASSYEAWADLMHPDDREAAEKKINEHVEKKSESFAEEFRLRTKTGDWRWVLSRGKVVQRDENNEPVRMAGTHSDITERKQIEQARQRLNEELEAKNKELASIMYAASHDLKSPLVNIQGFSYELFQSCDLIRSALAAGANDADAQKAVNTALNEDVPNALDFIIASTAKMDSLLSGLLDLCRINSIAADTKPIDMNVMMADIITSMEYQLRESGVKIDVEPLPPCAGDPLQINRVFSNLLTNALKFLDESRPGQIRVYGNIQNNNRIYCVEDNGVGIAPEHREKVFQIFYQLDPDMKKGEGIGLAIVRQIVEKQFGKVWVESELGKGSKFFVSLPGPRPMGVYEPKEEK